MTVKNARELTGSELDIATALALGFEARLSSFKTLYWSFQQFDSPYCWSGPIRLFKPSQDWKQAGGFIDEFGIEFKWVSDATLETYSYIMEEKRVHGSSHLEAACRLVVVSFIGEEVDIPDELLEAYNAKD